MIIFYVIIDKTFPSYGSIYTRNYDISVDRCKDRNIHFYIIPIILRYFNENWISEQLNRQVVETLNGSLSAYTTWYLPSHMLFLKTLRTAEYKWNVSTNLYGN